MYVLGLMREKFLVVKGNAAVRHVLGKCIKCRRVHGKVIEQQMADLPPDRMESRKPPFYRTGVDLFGPFFMKRGRAQIKHWGVIFTCLNMRAIHLEVASNLTSDSFISAFRRFLARRGQVRTIKCDCGTNFVGLRKVLDSSYEFLGENKVEATVNSRPLTIVTSDSRDPAPLTPNKLLNMGESPAGCDVATGSYSKQRWKQVQHMAEQFWARWKREYLSGLQQRQKWFKERRNVRVGDIVLMVNESAARCHWPLARVVQTKAGKDGLVRTVTVRREGKDYDRPLSKLVLILEEEQDLVDNAKR
ncbi:uncharacterized protein LOC135225243 [Macrobrachium nipponense]|uniref:uncharacterized protein LOC135225243 n=1 Tax=Macrobrachium nipponense TaxID=159736 RepID=UPI0030C7F933